MRTLRKFQNRMNQAWDATTEYRASFVSHSPVSNKKNKPYEEIVARKMQETKLSSNASSASRAEEEDPYEMIVRKKITNSVSNSNSGELEQTKDVKSTEEIPEIKADEVVSEHDHKNTMEIEAKPEPKRVKKDAKKAKKSVYDPSHLNRKRNSSRAKQSCDATSDLRPKFFRNPDHATAEEKKHLYGPFYVAWPKNKQMPSSYEELARIYGRRYQ